MKKGPEKIKSRILVPLAVVLLVLIGISIISIDRLSGMLIDEEMKDRLKAVQGLFEQELDHDARLLSGLIDGLARNENLRTAWRNKDRELLLHYATSLLEDMRSKYRVTHFYFIQADEVCFLRVHNPPWYGDTISRFTLNEARATNRPNYGIELGPLGTFTLRVVHPWSVDGGPEGFIELGEEIEHLTPALSKILGAELFFMVNKRFLDRGKWREGLTALQRDGQWDLLSDRVVVGRDSKDLRPELVAALDHPGHGLGEELSELKSGDLTYRGGFVPLLDAGGRIVGDIAVLRNVTKERMLHDGLRMLLISFGLALGITLIGFFYILVSRIERKLGRFHVSLSEEIQERKQAAEALAASEKQLRSILESSPIGVGICSMNDARIVFSNSQNARLFGSTVEGLIGSDARRFWWDEDQRKQCLEVLKKEGRVHSTEARARRTDGSAFWCLHSWESIQVDGEDCVLFWTYDIDRIKQSEVELRKARDELERRVEERTCELSKRIAEKERTEHALRESEEKYRSILENIEEAYYEGDLAGNFTFVNPAACRLLGYGEEEMIGMNNRRYTDPEDANEMLEIFKEVYRTGKPAAYHTYEVIRKDGAKRVVEGSSSLMRDANGKPIGFRGLVRDTTEEIRSREVLHQSRERLALAVDISGARIWEWNLKTDEFKLDDRILTDLGYALKESPLKSADVKAITDSSALPGIEAGLIEHFRGETSVYDHEYRIRTRSGEYRWIHNRGKVVKWDQQAKPELMVGSMIDVTDRKRADEARENLEAQLRQAEKMQAIGTLAGGIAHDFNNILGVIIGQAEMIEMFDAKKDANLLSRVRELIKAADRAKELVEQILAFSRQRAQKIEPVQLSSIVKEAAKFLRATIPSTIEIRQTIHGPTGKVSADPTQMHQILMNLCANAAHAMRESGGILELELNEVHLDETAAGHIDGITPGPYLKLSVTDTGHGMDPDIQKRIFVPYSTTKKAGEGTGLGLSVVHGIVKLHGGGISVFSRPGFGTTFSVYLPRIRSEAEEGRRAGTSAHVASGNERILFVDDEADLSKIAKEMLARLGYQVTAETSSTNALNLFKAKPTQFDLVITDLTMPKLSGLQLAQELTRIRSDIPIILCTGFSDGSVVEKAKGVGIRSFLNKPVGVRTLSKVVRQTLDDRNSVQMVYADEG
ncbi:MAG: PAS domain S-box protein [Deltaproteobacteria bacterium]|nr:PAS domain S-box protein [Deltaproteobacteria bacterium]